MKYSRYDPAALKEAYKFVMETGSSVRASAKKFGVPDTTLRDRVLNKVSVDVTKMWNRSVLNAEEEMKFTDHLRELTQLGYGYTQSEITHQASDFAIEIGKREPNQPLTRKWFVNFRKRHPKQNQVKTYSVPDQKDMCKKKECITNYYNKINAVVKQYKLDDKPENIYFIEDVDIDVPEGNKCNTVTLIGAGNAAGQKVAPYFVLVTGLSEDQNKMKRSHFITQSFKTYLNSQIIKYVKADSHILVIYDAHRTHLTVALIEWAKSLGIILFPLPPHLSHIVNFSGLSVFQPIGKKYREEYGEVTPYKHLSSTKGVVSILTKIYDALVSVAALQKLFSVSGIYPLQDSKIMCDFLQKQGILGQ